MRLPRWRTWIGKANANRSQRDCNTRFPISYQSGVAGYSYCTLPDIGVRVVWSQYQSGVAGYSYCTFTAWE